MERSNYDRRRGGAARGRGGGRGGIGGSGRRGSNNYQQLNQARSGGGNRGGGGRGGTQMGTNPPPAQPWGDRPVQGGQGGNVRAESAMGRGDPALDFRVSFNLQGTILCYNVDVPRGADGDAVSPFSFIFDVFTYCCCCCISWLLSEFICYMQ